MCFLAALLVCWAGALPAACGGDSAPPESQQPPAGLDLVEVSVAGRTLQVPQGFTVEVYVEGLGGARFFALGPDGVPYLSVPGGGRVVKLPDANRDGRADAVVVAVEGLNRPHGLAFRGDTLYVAETNRVVRFLPGSSQPQVVVDGLPVGGHWTKTIVFGPDDKLYVAAGSSCNVCDELDPRRAAVMRYNLDGSAGAIFARGLRNSVGLAFHPVTGELWAANNDRDWLGDDLPPERINIVKQGRFFAGFLPAGSDTPWGRPVDLLVLPDGSLLVSDDSGGRVFRVRYVGP